MRLWYVIQALVIFLWRRDSKSAVLLLIVVEPYLSYADCCQARDYFDATAAWRVKFASRMAGCGK